VPVPPATRIYHTGAGAYTVVPSGSFPPWAIALIIIGLLILAVMAVLLRRLRQTRP
jgi:tellurite resistance protein TehA-like permease